MYSSSVCFNEHFVLELFANQTLHAHYSCRHVREMSLIKQRHQKYETIAENMSRIKTNRGHRKLKILVSKAQKFQY